MANLVAAVGFALFGAVDWGAVLPLALGLFAGGRLGPIVVRHSNRGPAAHGHRRRRPRARGQARRRRLRLILQPSVYGASVMASRAWAIVGALSVTETVSWGVLYYAFAVFLLPMQRDSASRPPS